MGTALGWSAKNCLSSRRSKIQQHVRAFWSFITNQFITNYQILNHHETTNQFWSQQGQLGLQGHNVSILESTEEKKKDIFSY